MSSTTAAAAAAAAAPVQRSVEALEGEKQGLESDNAALRKALHSLEVSHLQQQRDILIADLHNGCFGDLPLVVEEECFSFSQLL
jgi:hypothetical protein